MSRRKRKDTPEWEFWKWFKTEPSHVNGQNAIVTQFYKHRLMTVLKGTFELECPEEWDKDYFLNLMITRGHMLITDSVIGVNPFKESLSGMNYMNNPIYATIATPVMPTFKRTLNEDAILIYFERYFATHFFTYNDLITFYATKMSLCDTSFDVNMINTRMAHLIEVENEAQSKTVKAAYDEISKGNPLVVVRKDGLQAAGANAMFNDVASSFIANDILDAKRTVFNEFLTAIGVNNANTDKKERLLTSEVAANNSEIKVNTELFRERLEEQSEKVRKMFGIKFRFSFKKFIDEVEEGIQYDSNGRGSGMGKDNGQADS